MENDTIDYGNFEALDHIMINRFGIGDHINSRYVMFPLTEEQEKEIDKLKEAKAAVNISLGKNGTVVNLSDIQVYGEINVDGEEEKEIINKLLLKEYGKYHIIPSGFDYNTGLGKANGKIPLQAHTTNYVQAFKYYHFRIGKPKRIIIVKVGR